MAGIGWKLERMMARGRVAGAAGAYLTGVAVTSGPWLLTAAVLVVLRLAGRQLGGGELIAERVITWIYALTVVLSAPVHIVVSRYAADRLFEGRPEAVAAPLRRALAYSLLGSSLLGTALVWLLHVPRPEALAGIILTTVIGGQWLLMSVGSGLSTPSVVLRAFGLGAPVALMAGLALARLWGDAGFLWGYAAGQALTLLLIFRGVLAHLPDDADESARLEPAFRRYVLLAISAFAYNLAIWLDKLTVALCLGREPAWRLAAVSAVAWFAVIPAFAWLFVQAETAFHRAYRGYYDALEVGATLRALRRSRRYLEQQAWRLVRGTAAVQLVITAPAVLCAGPLAALTGLAAADVPALRLALVGVTGQVITFAFLLLLYYFDLRREALAVAVALLGAVGLLAGLSTLLGATAVTGYAVGSAVAAALGWFLLRRAIRDLLVDTFQSQPLEAPP